MTHYLTLSITVIDAVKWK